MIVIAWFTVVFLVILFGFGFVGATLWHWHKEKKKAVRAASHNVTLS